MILIDTPLIIFKGKIEVNRLKRFMKALNVRGEAYGIEV